MNRPRRMLLLTFLESFATICVERGVYFFARDRLGFTRTDNLWLALAFGVAYATGALCSHRISLRLKEKRLLVATLCVQFAGHVILVGFSGVPAMLFVFSTLLGLANGMKWPIIESYVSAGQDVADTAKAVGRFNVAWATSVPLALAAAGPLIDHWPAGLFLLPAMLNLCALGLTRPLRLSPLHLPHDHPARPAPEKLRRWKSLLTASRWMMLASYSALWVLAALMPRVFDDLGCSVSAGTALSGLLDAMRLLAFLVLGATAAWHGRPGMIVAAMIVLPGAFFLILFGGSLPAVLAGEVLFGLAGGAIYYGALYYAMVVANASVDAGGAHEGLIGAGFALGPAAGLAGVALAGALGNETGGMLLGIGPLFAVAAVAAAVALGKIHPPAATA